MSTIIKRSILAVSMTTVLSSTAYAVEPNPIELDNGLSITPMLDTGYKVDNNIFSDPDKTQSSGIITVVPSVNLRLNDGVNIYNADFKVSSGTFVDSSDDDYLDGAISLSAHLEPSSQDRADFSAKVNWVTEARGTGILEGLPAPKPLTYRDESISAGYEYGALSSSARVAFDAEYYKKGYTNGELITQFRDFDSIKLASTLYYSTGASTEVLLEISADAIDYDTYLTPDTNRDNDDYRALAGVKWEATALTSGEIKVGYQDKSFDTASRESFTGLSWDASVEWKPLTYSTIELSTMRAAEDPLQGGDYIEKTDYEVSWNHNWNEKLSSNFATSYAKGEYNNNGRTDETTTLSASVDYAIARWVDVSVFADLTDKDSTQANLIFDKSIVGVNFIFSM